MGGGEGLAREEVELGGWVAGGAGEDVGGVVEAGLAVGRAWGALVKESEGKEEGGQK